MYFRYGSYQHPDNEVLLQSFEVIPVRSDRNMRREAIYRMHVTGELLDDNQSDLNDKITQLIAAYAYDFKDAALYHDDGTITRHALLNTGQCASGVQIVHRSWPRGDPGEYATYRHFSIGFQARYTELDSQLLAFRERVRKEGNGGTEARLVTMLTGPPRRQLIAQQTPVRLIQEGVAVGYDAYPLADVPGPIYPDLELVDLRELNYDSPTWAGLKFTDFAVSWRYVMHSPADVAAFPNAL